MKTYGGKQVEDYFKKTSFEEIRRTLGNKQFEFLAFDDDESCVLYNLCVYYAAAKAGFDVASTIPKEDYIEVVCPRCNQIEIYKFEDIDKIRCLKCNSGDPIEQLKLLVLEQGYEIISVDHYTGEVYYKCPICRNITVVNTNDSLDLTCKGCVLSEIAEDHGFTIRRTVPDEYDEILEPGEILLECDSCDSYIKIDIEKDDLSKAYEFIRCPYCELEKLAEENGLRQEDDSGTLNIIEEKGVGWYPFVCNICGSIQYIHINPIISLEELQGKLEEIKKFTCEERVAGNCEAPDVIKHTIANNVVWFADVYNLFTAMPLYLLNERDYGESGSFSFPEEKLYNSYIGVDFTNDKKTCYLFVEFESERFLNPWSSEYLFATFDENAVITKTSMIMEGEVLWPVGYYKLRSLVKAQIETNETIGPSRKLYSAYETYIDLIFHIQRDANEFYEAAEEISQKLRVARRIYELKTGDEFPKKINIDKRLSSYLESVKCSNCEALNHGFVDYCWCCGKRIE